MSHADVTTTPVCFHEQPERLMRRGGYKTGTPSLERHGTVYLVRDSKDVCGPVLAFAPGKWHAFIDGVKLVLDHEDSKRVTSSSPMHR